MVIIYRGAMWGNKFLFNYTFTCTFPGATQSAVLLVSFQAEPGPRFYP